MKLPETDPDQLRATIAAQAEELSVLRAEVAALRAQVEAWTARLSQHSANSSRPPASDPPGRPPPPTSPSGRRPGGQPGHPGRCRALLAPEQVDEVIVCLPGQGDGCGAALATAAGASDPPDERRQGWEGWELPPVAAVVTAYRLAARRCAGGGRTTRATLPLGVGVAGCGPRLTAVSATLSGRYRLSKRETAACLGDVFGVALSVGTVGTVSALEQPVSAALAPVVTEAGAALQQSAVVNMDETGWREGRRRVWLWAAVTATLTIFPSNARRGGAVARALVAAAWRGMVGSDRGTMDGWVDQARRQLCWAHLKRDFQKRVDWGPGLGAGTAPHRRAGAGDRGAGLSPRASLPGRCARPAGVAGGAGAAPAGHGSRPGGRRDRRPSRRSGALALWRAGARSRSWNRRAGPSSSCPGSSPRTTPPSRRCGRPCSGARAASAPMPLPGVALSRGCSP